MAAGQRQRLLDGGHDRAGRSAAAASDADDQVLYGFGGRGDDRLGAQNVCHRHGKLVRTALMSAHADSRPSVRRRPDHDDRRIDRLVPQARGNGPDDRADGGDVDQAPVGRKKLAASARRAGRIAGRRLSGHRGQSVTLA